MRPNFRQPFSHLFVASFFFAAAALVLTGCGKKGAAGQDGQDGRHSVTLSWAASTSPVAGYYVYRTSPPNKNYNKLTPEPLTPTQYTDTAVEAGHTYTYYVTAVDSKKMESPASKVVSAIVPTP
jgi:fibronectin type 3 domain-containing protein